jgi:uncharacterized protein YfaS (alpha-2-macroglobulin family)
MRLLNILILGVGLILPLNALARNNDDFKVSPLETQVLGQSNWIKNGTAAVRVIVKDHNTGKPLEADVIINLRDRDGYQLARVFSGKTDARGTLDAPFHVPAFRSSNYMLGVYVTSPLGKDSIEQSITVTSSTQVLLTADKPLYQPGQVIHIRALALDTASHRAADAGTAVTFEVEDARGNKVFKKRDKLSRFGLAATDFQLADEVNMGTFTIRALIGEQQTEKKVNVEKYALPKFKITLNTEKPYYLPGETVKGTLQAAYFFGKPVAGGDVTLDVNTIDIGVTKLTELKGKTDEKGSYKFEYRLPQTFVGQPFEQGKAVVELAATLKDTADHAQEANLTRPVVQQPVLLVVVPEHQGLVPGVENRLFIAAATPDGQPLKHKQLTVLMAPTAEGVGHNLTKQTINTDDYGIAVFSFRGREGMWTVTVQATEAGQPAQQTVALQSAAAQNSLILRVDRPLAKVGDTVGLTALCSSPGGTLYIDVIRNKQTVLTKAVDMVNGRAELALPLDQELAGTLQIHAYKILPNEDIIRDTRTVIVSPADDLKIRVTADKGEYRPGGDAHLSFLVRDGNGRPVSAALGLVMVDESVYALSELQPGLEKIYFTLEKQLMEPKYEIHGLSPTYLLHPGIERRSEDERQRAATLVLSAVEAAPDFDYRVNTYDRRFAEVRTRAVTVMEKAHKKIYDAVRRYAAETGIDLAAADALQTLVRKGYITQSDLLDPWGNPYRSNLNGDNRYRDGFSIESAGPDGQWGTNDDILNITFYDQRVRFRRFARDGVMMGGMGGAMGGRAVLEEMPVALAARAPGPGMPALAAGAVAKADNMAVLRSTLDSTKSDGGGDAAVHVRQYFPETLLWNPALLTDEHGEGRLTVPLADSITTWRLSMLANTPDGQLGSDTSSVKVFQEFFTDIDLPVSLTQDDRVELPVTVYNYLNSSQTVRLELTREPWFTLDGDNRRELEIGAGQVKVVYYPIVVRGIGSHSLTVVAHGSKLSDAVKRTVAVLPDGKEYRPTVSDTLTGTSEQRITLPEAAIKGASNLWVKFYPGTFSQVVEGIDGILQMPNGCFEQTSSTTYPDVLVLDYLKQTKKIKPEIQMKAEQYINVGYQRLVTFEVKSGGFSWFGDEPAHQILTAYGLLEFSDMARVHDVDPAVISRTQTWLAGKQNPDGTWIEHNQGIAEGIINRQSDALRSTAYVAWALAESGYKGPQVASGAAYVKAHRSEAKDPYTLAVMLNLLTTLDPRGDDTAAVANDLIATAVVKDKIAYWQSDTQTFTGANGQGADLEATGLAAYGLSKWGGNAGFVNKVLTYLVQSKDSYGTWQTTQGTVWSMKALLYASRNASGGKGQVTVIANGKPAASFAITPDDSDVMRQFDLAQYIQSGANDVRLQFAGEGSLAYQVVGRYYLPWDKVDLPRPEFQPLDLKVDYDKTTLARDDTATVTVTIRNRTDHIAEMPLIDVGIPPGFDVLPDNLDDAVKKGTISKYTVAARQVILYMQKLGPNETVKVTYQVKARFPVKARTPLSKAYPYYNPEKVATVAPTDIVVER